LRTGARSLVDVAEHRPSRNLAKDLAGQARRREPGGNDSDGFHSASVIAQPATAQGKPLPPREPGRSPAREIDRNEFGT